ncbi:MAG TPA: M61 family metallopeptidase [Azospira sp.]|nr:M61 family metallopeptidase [Azospira sp.]
MKNTAIHYSLRPADPAAHLFEVSCRVDRPDPAGQRFALPAWIPGSYLIRDFARHIVAIRAEAGGQPVALSKLDKHTWQAAALPAKQALTVTCTVYAWDLSVRGAHLDRTHAFFNGTSVFLRVLGREESPCLVDLLPPKGKEYAGWRVATALEPARGEKGKSGAAKAHGFGRYAAANYDELIDHPVEMGTFTLARFKACGVPHEVAISGRHDCDFERLTADLKKICEWQIRFFGEPAPMKKYVFLVTAVGDGYGGLEHRASTALLCSRDDLPYRGMEGVPERYRTFLGLCSHEYFHTWNVKRIKPAAFVPYDLDRENHTTLLWAFEGFTSYYDDLALLKSGVITQKDWLELAAKNIDNVLRGPGRLTQSLAESSFDAWSKYYRQDENTPNAVVSYYAKGALVALALDLTLRAGSDGKVSLDDVMRALWQRHGQTGVGVGDDDIRRIAEELSGRKLTRFFADAVHGTADLPLAKLLKPFGLSLVREAANPAPTLGAKTTTEGGEVRLATVYRGSAAERAGLSAGDVLVAIDGIRVTPATLDRQLARRRPGDTLAVHAFRRDELLCCELRLDPPAVDSTRLVSDERRNVLRAGWWGGDSQRKA